MRGNYLGWILALAAASTPAGGGAMSAAQGRCHVANAERLPAETGGQTAVCVAFENAIAAHAPDVKYDALELHVFSQAALGATVVRDGRTLVSWRFSIMDKNLNPASIERFAQSFASEVAKTHKA